MIEAPALPFLKRGMKRPAPARARQASPAPNGSFDRDYWLGHCEGYRVDGVEGRIGFVDAVRVLRGATVLAVRAGRLGRRILLMPAEEVVFIVPRARRIWLQTPATIIDSEAAEGRGGFGGGVTLCEDVTSG